MLVDKYKTKKNIIKIRDVEISSESLVIIAGPCAVENREQFLSTAISVKNSGANILRGGVYKPRTSPYSFQGLKDEGLKYISEASNITGMPCICEATSIYSIEGVAKYADIIQIGARNMQNFELLRQAAKTDLPILLKRGFCSTIDEWLNAAEYIMYEGNNKIILCERGIRTFETATRNTLDISAVAVIKERTNLPIIIDPSHASGNSKYIYSLTKASIASGADGVMIEVHPNPKQALSDGEQSLDFHAFDRLVKECIIPYAKLENRHLN